MTINREDQRFWDVRTIDRRVRRGFITKKEIEKHLKSLPDVADKSEKLGIGADDDGDDLDDDADASDE